jgi:uncharacterized protein YgbK (DUF1537 family)
VREQELLAACPPELFISAAEVAAAVSSDPCTLIVLDDDPTGTQSVAGLPVLTRWEVDDFRWALDRCAPAVYVLTNARSLDSKTAAERIRDVVENAMVAAAGARLRFVSRSDSTLRGHFPLDTDVIACTLAEFPGGHVDGVVVVPAFPDAGRVTIGGIHYLRSDGELSLVSDSEFAKDATFGFSNSDLSRWVEEKTGGRVLAGDVIRLTLEIIRSGPDAVAEAVSGAFDSRMIVADAVTENDLRALALGLFAAENRGKELLYRVGPPFVRARIGQEPHPPLTRDEIYGDAAPVGSGLIVVGSHVGLTTSQLAVLRANRPDIRSIELDVDSIVDGSDAASYLDATSAAVVGALARGDVVLHTSRRLIKSRDPELSLAISRTVSAAIVALVQNAAASCPLRYVVAKGGITSSDVAAFGLDIRHATVIGPMLPGIVSLWRPADGPAAGLPYVVFAGNVGDDQSLLKVVATLGSAETDATGSQSGNEGIQANG